MSVYFAQVGRYIKVGYSANPERRVANLFKSGTRYARPVDCPLDAPRRLIATIPGGLNEEDMCHGMLEDFAAGCEFFIDEPPVREFIAEAIEGRFARPVRDAGPFEPVSNITDEDRAQLQYVLDHFFDRVPGPVAGIRTAPNRPPRLAALGHERRGGGGHHKSIAASRRRPPLAKPGEVTANQRLEYRR